MGKESEKKKFKLCFGYEISGECEIQATSIEEAKDIAYRDLACFDLCGGVSVLSSKTSYFNVEESYLV